MTGSAPPGPPDATCSPPLARASGLALAAWLVLAGLAVAQAAGDPEARTPAFRLGTAAAPLRWSTGLGDFDNDGRIDVAVADHLTVWAGPDYVVEVCLSSADAQRLVFSSPEPGLDLTVTDADGDGDLDIVLTPLFSRAVVLVWVNDGAGRFEQRRAVPPSGQHSFAAEGEAAARVQAHAAAVLPSPPRDRCGCCLAPSPAALFPGSRRNLVARDARPPWRMAVSPSHTRAPPLVTVIP